MKTLASLLLLIVCSVNAHALAFDQTADIGPEVGKVLPVEISLSDQKGEKKNLPQLMGEKGIILVFFRSADWCPYCRSQLIDLQQNAFKQAAEKGYTTAGISYDSVDILDKFSRKFSISYPLLSDEGSKVIDSLKLRNPAYKGKSRFYGVPYPMVLVIGKDGIVKAKLFEENYRKRPATSTILAALD